MCSRLSDWTGSKSCLIVFPLGKWALEVSTQHLFHYLPLRLNITSCKMGLIQIQEDIYNVPKYRIAPKFLSPAFIRWLSLQHGEVAFGLVLE